ncbi:hypothetical protein JNB63_03760 [Microbacterium trichothecenolyticum]|uniref:hypothetical protein n=1 Tax=Microbacterium trichothecenolyticum TaxID=69370 RepID=UPI001C6F24E2|nr:hypothetical protein [Microbacterium trichothecenolyticum]MBW9119200.1 hypothetical protein [Microbacterium trichothecenolyticum]
MVVQSRLTRIVIGCVALTALATVVTGCRPESPAAPSGSPTGTTQEQTPDPSVSPTETDKPAAGFEAPGACEEIYSAAMLAQLQSANPPLNDPGVTMLSTENADLLEIIHSGAPTLRCSWGQPSEYGLATNVTAIDAGQEEAVLAALPQAGFGCEPLGGGTVCRIEQKGVTLDDEEYTRGETHYVGGGGLVTTAWINFAPEGYTEDIVATLWG